MLTPRDKDNNQRIDIPLVHKNRKNRRDLLDIFHSFFLSYQK